MPSGSGRHRFCLLIKLFEYNIGYLDETITDINDIPDLRQKKIVVNHILTIFEAG